MKRALLLLAASACTDPAVEMHLVLPQQEPQMDLSCISAVKLDAFGNDQGDASTGALPEIKSDCVDLAHAPTSFADLASMMHGRFVAPLPSSGLLGVEVHAFAGHCSDTGDPYEAMIYGGAPGASKDIAVPLVGNISCTATSNYTVHPLDLTNAGACGAQTTGYVYAADVRPSLMGGEFPRMYVDYGISAANLATDGTAQVASYNAIMGAGCIAAGYDDMGNARYGLTCVDVTKPTLCGGAPGTVEVGVVSDLYYGYFDHDLAAQYGAPTFGAAFDIASKQAIAGATVTIDQGGEGQVVYVEPGAGTLTTHAAPTGASGMFLVYAKGAVAITVAAPGQVTEHYIVAGTPQEPATLIAALPKM